MKLLQHNLHVVDRLRNYLFDDVFRTDNAIKNHFYSTLRKLISRIQKDEIPPEMSKFIEKDMKI
jgi:hypothetical protein